MAESNLNALFEAGKGMKPKPKSPAHTGNSMGKGMTNKGMRSGTDLSNSASDQDFLGMGFDMAVRKGVDAARTAFAKRIENLEEGKKRALLARFENEIATQKVLNKTGRDGEREVYAYRDAADRGEKINYEKARMRMNNLQPKRPAAAKTASPAPKPTPTGTDRYYGEGGI